MLVITRGYLWPQQASRSQRSKLGSHSGSSDLDSSTPSRKAGRTFWSPWIHPEWVHQAELRQFGDSYPTNHLVGGIPTPLKNDGVRQLGWWHSQYMGKWKMFQTTHQPLFNDVAVRSLNCIRMEVKTWFVLRNILAASWLHPGWAWFEIG